MFYNCYDISNDVEFTIKEFKYLDGLDLLIKKIDRNIYQNKKQVDKSNNEADLIDDYLSKNPRASIVHLNGFKFVKVVDDFENKFFFVDKNLIASFEIVLETYKETILVNCLIKQLSRLKQKN